MKRKNTETRIAELNIERSKLTDELEAVRIEAKQAIIDGKEPTPKAAGLAERIAIIDDAIAELSNRLENLAESEARARRMRSIETACGRTAKRTKLAKRVDEALELLTNRWSEYSDTLRKDFGTVASAGGELGTLDRALTNNRMAEPLVKALIHVGGVAMARAFGIDTAIRPQHACPLSDLEERVAESLRVENLRIRAASPQPNMAREAQAELERIK